MRIGDARDRISWAWQKTCHILGIEIIVGKPCLCFKKHMVWLNRCWWKIMISSLPYDMILRGPYFITTTQKYKCDYACSKVWVSSSFLSVSVPVCMQMNDWVCIACFYGNECTDVYTFMWEPKVNPICHSQKLYILIFETKSYTLFCDSAIRPCCLARKSPLSTSPALEWLDVNMHGFLYGCWGSSWRPCTCIASTVSTELFPQHLFLKDFIFSSSVQNCVVQYLS